MRDYERTLAWLSLDHAGLEFADFEPPMGTECVRKFLGHRWNERTPRTRAKNLSILRDLFRWAVREGRLHGDPTLAIQRPRWRQRERHVFKPTSEQQILDAEPSAPP